MAVKATGRLAVELMSNRALWETLQKELTILDQQCAYGADPRGRQARCLRCRFIVRELRMRGDQLTLSF